jgi:two-component system chemotaxis response regulator CheB
VNRRKPRHEANGSALRRVVVIGASAGGVEALTRVVRGMPPDLPAPVLIVLHVSPQGPSLMPEILNRAGPLPARHPRDGEPLEPGRVYVAPPDHHLLVKSTGRIALVRGPRENGARPAVDPLFRTAARCFGSRVIGIVLSGGLDDGTAGAIEIKRRGGVVIAQQPEDALFPSMPQSVIDHVAVDRILSLDEIGPAVTSLALAADEEGVAEMEVRDCDRPDVADVGSAALKDGQLKGPPSSFTCPECGGALWELSADGRLLTYRCHVGHGYTADGLMAAQTRALEEALWSGLRALEESAEMRRRMARRARSSHLGEIARRYEEDAALAEKRADAIRAVLIDGRPDAPADNPDAHDRVERNAARRASLGNGRGATAGAASSGKSKAAAGGNGKRSAAGAAAKRGKARTSGRRRHQKTGAPVPRPAPRDAIVPH